MSSIADLNKHRRYLENEGREILEKIKDVQYRAKIAEAQNDAQLLSNLRIEADVLSQMMKEKTLELEKVSSEMASQQAVFNAEANKANIFKNVALGASFLCFFMPDFIVGLVYFIACICIAFYFFNKAGDQKAYAAGYTKDEWERTKKEIGENAKREQRDRDALAKSIADHLKK